MLKSQQELNFSPYTDLYDKLVPQNRLSRKINELIESGFIREDLKDKHCPDNGRTAEDPEYPFRFLFLKYLHPMSDADLAVRALHDLSCKYFPGLNPEDVVINASALSKFRKLRLKGTGHLDLLIEKNNHCSDNYRRRKPGRKGTSGTGEENPKGRNDGRKCNCRQSLFRKR